MLTDELESVSMKKNKYLSDKDKLLKVVERLELEKQLLEERQDTLTYEI